MTDQRHHREQIEASDQEKLLSYIRQEMNAEEQHAFESHTESDPFTADALEGLEQIPADRIRHLQLEISKKTKKELYRRRRKDKKWSMGFWLHIAIILILGILLIAYYIIRMKIGT